ncbi:ribonuclease P protein subunit p21-like [Apostichopus japonicus]
MKKKVQKTFLNQNRDIHLRMNHLFQMAHQVLLSKPENKNLARFYISMMKRIATRLVMKLHPSIKRAICKKCDMLLIPGITATVRIKAHRQKHKVVQCVECGKVKRFVYNPNHILWVDKPEAVYHPQEMEDKRVAKSMQETQGKPSKETDKASSSKVT